MWIRSKCIFIVAAIRCICPRRDCITRTQPLVRQPMDRVFFANTDSQGPESTTNEAIVAAQRTVRQVEAKMAGKVAGKETALVG